MQYQKLIILLSLVLCACSKSATTYQHPLDTFRAAVGSEPPSLDPALAEDNVSNRIMYDLFEGLVDFDQHNQPIPGLAQSWDVSRDAKTYTFKLRSGLKFSDGSTITAKDFVYSWQRLVNPKTASPYNYLLSNVINGQKIIDGKAAPDSLGIEAVNDQTFKVTLTNPDSAFLKICTMRNLSVTSQKIINQFGNEWTDPAHMVTSGAYMLKEHVINGYVLAVKNPNYYNQSEVAIPQVKYFAMSDVSTQVATYKSGGLDMTDSSVPMDDYQNLQKEYSNELYTVRQEGIVYYDFNMQLPVFRTNQKLRQALTMAVDREVLARDVLKGTKVPLYTVVTPTVDNGDYKNLAYPWAAWPRDKQLAEARKLYAEAGYGTGNPLKLSISYNTDIGNRRITLAMAAMWKSVLGVEVTVQNQEWKMFLQTRHKGDYQIARDGWLADYDDVTSYTPLFQCTSPQNNSHYCNPAYDKLISEAMVATNPIRQRDLYTQALTTARDDYAIIPLFQYSYTQLVRPYISNYAIKTNYFNHIQTKWFRFSR